MLGGRRLLGHALSVLLSAFPPTGKVGTLQCLHVNLILVASQSSAIAVVCLWLTTREQAIQGMLQLDHRNVLQHRGPHQRHVRPVHTLIPMLMLNPVLIPLMAPELSPAVEAF